MNPDFQVKNTAKTRPAGEKPRILVAPLDWGLGHATRCIPLIRELLAQGAEVWLAGEGAQEELLRAEFPGLPFLPLPGYRIRYAKTAAGLPWKMLRQTLQLRRAIRSERQWLKTQVEAQQFTAVISDNRYGLCHDQIPSYFITHQLRIKSPAGPWTERLLQQKNYRYINRFTECWIPDLPGAGNLAGELAHPALMPTVPVQYLGWLTRFSGSPSPVKKGHLLILLSGPEPQRSIWEDQLVKEIGHYNGTATFVRGLPGHRALIPSTGMLQFYNHLGAAELEAEMKKAEWVICRSGYSTIMDAAVLQKKCIYVPTPGQTEQQYLGLRLQEQGIALCFSQRNFTLKKALEAAATFPFSPYPVSTHNALRKLVQGLLAQTGFPALG